MKKIPVIKLYRSENFYHIYNRGNNKALICRTIRDYIALRGLMYRFAKEKRLLVVCYCFMPNHFHMVIKLRDDLEGISKFMRAYMTSYVMYFNRKYRRVGHLFQGPFQARKIEDDRDLYKVIEYIKRNPVEAGLISSKTGPKYRWLNVKRTFDRRGGLT